ncbi:cupin domain-containing protein [Marinobacterium sedimentorum]|uniref:cupin domain-containing protein n=1 Tax=Marinobacterium sedimentorum TaxID=2927804 RepID=UPI0020C687D4|nr:cupin domain-containing protein [Marinobacterium sedimentorum]MCP8690445.1 cupin domain-containing protein [Marinobacterium sedimentorum]
MTSVKVVNLLQGLAPARSEEVFESLVQQPGFRLERILSWGQVTPEGEWYDQAEDEWVLLLSGAARLLVEGQEAFALLPGDTVLLPAHCRHRVIWTDPAHVTVWLALHYSPEGQAAALVLKPR